MPEFTIESTYRLPVYRHVTYVADTPEAACRLAIEDDDWSGQKEDHDTSGETYVTGIWQGDDAAYRGSSIPVPAHFKETVQRQATHFEVLLGLLKIMLADAETARPTPSEWRSRAAWAIALGEAILAGARGPDESADLPTPQHILAALHEHRVRDQVASIVEADPTFAGVDANAVTAADIHAACLAVVAATDLAEEIGSAEHRAALTALRRHTGDRR